MLPTCYGLVRDTASYLDIVKIARKKSH